MKRMFAMLLAAALMLALFAGCGESGSASETSSVSAVSEVSEEPSAAPEEEQTAAPEEGSTPEEIAEPLEATDFTAANAAMDYSGYKAMLKDLHTELPITEDPVTLSYFFGFEGTTLNYIDGGVMEGHQVWKWLMENTGVNLELKVVNKTQETDQFNLMVASSDYTDLVPGGDYSSGVEAAYEDEVFTDLSDYVEEKMPNYWKIVNSDQNLLREVQDGNKFLVIYALKDQVANPGGIGTFVRMDWLEDLDMNVPETYDELTEVLRAFKTEKGASEPMALFNTVSMQNGILMGGFGSQAELSANGIGGDATSGYYQEDGRVIYGATANGTRKFLSWLNELYDEGLINFDNMQSRETNPFSDLNAGKASDGSNGYIFTNQPFGGEYTNMAVSSGDTECNWWPVRDVAEEKGQIINFYEEVTLKDMTSMAVTTDCDNVEVALQFLDYGYSYEGALLYNFGFAKGDDSGQYQTYDFDDNGEPVFDEAALLAVAEQTNIASGVVCTKDLAGIVYDTRLAFSFGDRELACFDAWKTDKTANNILGSATTLTAEEGTDASAIYSDIITYVATSVLQFIRGDMDVNDDAVWNSYVADIEGMNLAGLTEIIQGAYDRAH